MKEKENFENLILQNYFNKFTCNFGEEGTG